MKTKPLTYQFKVTLLGITPPVWRRIQVPADYSFWDLHVAMQDALGWQDYHLHGFYFALGKKTLEIGIPIDPPDDHPFLTSWEVKIADYFRVPGDRCRYDYDFGDDWQHELLLEAILLPDLLTRLPACIGGARACPPEDCGGVGGYADLLNLLKLPNSDEYDEMIGWLRGQAPDNVPFDPERFSPAKVQFDDPHKRWKHAFVDSVERDPAAPRQPGKKREKAAAKTAQPGVQQFKKALAALKRRREFIPTRGTRAYADHLIAVLEELRSTVTDPRTGVELVASFFEADAAVFSACDDSNGSVGQVFTFEAGDLFARYAAECVDKEWLTDLVVRLFENDDYGVRDVVVNRAGLFLPEAEMRALVERFLARAERETRIFQKRHWYYAVESLAKQLRDAPLFERIHVMVFEGSLNSAGIIDIAQAYFDAGDAGTALHWLLQIPMDNLFHAYERDHLLLAVHKKLGNRRDETEVAWRIFRGSRGASNLNTLLSIIGETERSRVIAEESGIILKSENFSSTDAQFLCGVQRFEDVETYILRHAGKLQEQHYASLLPLAEELEEHERYLGATVVYRALLESTVVRAISKYYHRGVRYLRKLDQLSQNTDRWGDVQPHEAYKELLRTAHARKSSFWSRYHGKE